MWSTFGVCLVLFVISGVMCVMRQLRWLKHMRNDWRLVARTLDVGIYPQRIMSRDSLEILKQICLI